MYEDLQNPYEMDEKRARILDKVQFYLSKVFKAMFYVIFLVLKIALNVFLNVLRTFGIKIGSSRENGWA